MNFYCNRMELKSADTFKWASKTFLTIKEFIYLAAGYEPLFWEYEPLPDGKVDQYFHLKNIEFEAFYKEIKTLSTNLPKITTETINVQHCPDTKETQYEVTFLMKWANEVSLKLSQNPVIAAFKERIISSSTEGSLLNIIESSKTYEPLSWIYENYYRGKQSFLPANSVLTDIREKFNDNQNPQNGQLYLSDNDCQLLHNFMRMVLDLKRK